MLEKRLYEKLYSYSIKPPFSIRCVEVGDDDDRGDTLGQRCKIKRFLSKIKD